MNKYVGKYRVVCEFCRITLKPLEGDTYIYCANGGQIYRYNKHILVYYRPGKNKADKTIKSLIGMGIEVINDYSTPEDLLLYFYEKDISRIAEVFKARTLGAGIAPTSKRNLRLFPWYRKSKPIENE
jgi:hypothetical protein